MSHTVATVCPLCHANGGVVIFHNDQLRVIQVDEADEPGFAAFYRVVWQTHVAELSELTLAQRHICISAVVALEQALRDELQPTKINLAALGNMVPHLHWHVVARFDWDSHFPAPIWAAARRPVDAQRLAAVRAKNKQVHLAIVKNIAAQAVNARAVGSFEFKESI